MHSRSTHSATGRALSMQNSDVNLYAIYLENCFVKISLRPLKQMQIVYSTINMLHYTFIEVVGC